MKARTTRLASAMFLAGLYSLGAQAFTFEGESVKGSFDSTVTFGFGKRLKNQSCSLVGDVTGPCGASADFAVWSNGDDGNMNYNKGDFFSTYLKGNHELLLKLPSDVTVMARANWMHDFAADKTRRTELLGDAKQQMTSDVNLMDLWISKEFNIGDQRARVRVGNQVVSWGESLFAPGGINSTNAMDINRLSSPGMQLKEVFLPAPIISFATGLGHGLNFEAYYQARWNRSKLPAVGSYWSVADFAGKGSHKQLYLDFGGGPNSLSWLNGVDAPTIARMNGVDLAATEAAMERFEFPGPGIAGTSFAVPQTSDLTPKNSGQYGLSLRWTPPESDLNLGFYYMNYHDKTPNGRWWKDTGLAPFGTVENVFLENRKMYGVSVNTSIGNWAVGAELSYRPKDAVSLSACTPTGAGGTAQNFVPGAFGPGAYDCDGWIDMKKYQTHITGILALTPGDHGWFLNAVGAQTGTFLGEFVWTHYPEADPNKIYTRTVNGTGGPIAVDQVIAGGLYTWPANGDKTTVKGTGTRDSFGYMFDFSLVYDSTLISGWQVIPGIFMMGALKGETPNLVAFWQEGAKSANFYVNFVQNPAKWQAGVNYTTFWGGKSEYHQVLKDRDFVGGYVSYNF
ncbi:MAG: DUF1302 domain-containing protein [Sulfuritalea sp.]|nr:DUF1302 domain-containing protein [Sulfuritalea sp.]